MPDDDAYNAENDLLSVPIEMAIKWRRTLGRKLRATIAIRTGMSDAMAATVLTLMEAHDMTFDEAVYYARAQTGAALKPHSERGDATADPSPDESAR